ncbi:MAG: hypothetical protein M3455_01505 [Actinomycetota bacterium]|jgi:hypothetical protein|nr:hypothetical protein [Actinomycetota bacterium]
MRPSKWSTAGPLIIMLSGGLLLSSCADPPAEADFGESGPAQVEVIEGSEVSRVTLTLEAAERLGVTTTAVVEEQVAAQPGTVGSAVERKVIPYGALLYDNTGATWAYTTVEPLVFIRESVTIDYIEGDQVVLVDGPSTGTDVVTLGAAELFGAELGLGQ